MATVKEEKSSPKPSGTCPVCGDQASTVNYGALSCMSCRTFFRRNGFHNRDDSSCRYDGQCEINILTRKLCTSCRFSKCLAVGMSPELIRKEDLSATKRKSTEPHSSKPVEDQSMMTPSQENISNDSSAMSQSPLTSADQNILSSVVHAFDTFSPMSSIRETIDTVNASASSLDFNLSQTLQMMSSISTSLQTFIRSTPDFKVLSTSEQCSLLQRNVPGLLLIGGSYFMRKYGIFDVPENEKILIPLYGREVVEQIKTISVDLHYDPTLSKLLLMAFAFSSNSFTQTNRASDDKDSLLLGTFRLFGSQNVYAELLWKYLVFEYNYDGAVQRFSKLTKRFLDTIKLSTEIYELNQVFRVFVDSILEQLLNNNEITDIPLWGKT